MVDVSNGSSHWIYTSAGGHVARELLPSTTATFCRPNVFWNRTA